MKDDDIDAPAMLAATTLMSICMLYEDVKEPLDVWRRAQITLNEAFAGIASEIAERAGAGDE